MKKLIALIVFILALELAEATLQDKYNINAEGGAVVYIGDDQAPLAYSIQPKFNAWGAVYSNSDGIETFKGLASLTMIVKNEDGNRIVFNLKMTPKQILHCNANMIQNMIHIDNTGVASYWKAGQLSRIYFDSVEYHLDRLSGLLTIEGESPELDFKVVDMISSDGLAAKVKEITEDYIDEDSAVADGYSSTVECVESPLGAMGIHYIKPSLFDCQINELEPEMLLYIPTEDGPKLIGVEYFIPSACVDSTPMLFGHEMDGPMPGHGPGQPEHYDLHEWLWEPNPSGIFEEFNPNLSC